MLLILFICVLSLPIFILMVLNIAAIPFALTEKGNKFLNKLSETRLFQKFFSFLEWYYNFFYASKTAKTIWLIIFLIILVYLTYLKSKG